MLIVLIILTILAIWLSKIIDCDEYISYWVSIIGSLLLGIFDVIVVIWIIVIFNEGIVAERKAKMYEEENKKIEEQIDILVKQYMNYESDTLEEFKSESSITLVSLYPDLKSDTLVSKQLDIYINNNSKIKELKEKQIELSIGKWLLYFGK